MNNIKKIVIFFLSIIFIVSSAFVMPVFAGSKMEPGDEQELIGDTNPSTGGSGSYTGGGGNNSGGGGNNQKPKKPATISEVKGAVIKTQATTTGEYGKKHIQDNFWLWTFRNTTTKKTTSDKGEYKYIWKPQEVGEYLISSEPNSKYQYFHKQYYLITAANYKISHEGDGVNRIFDYAKYTYTTSKVIYDYTKDEYDSTRTRKWNFTVCYPPTTIVFPNDRQEEIPTKHNLVL